MKIIFPTPGISYLRYFGPVIEYIQDEKNIEIILAIRRDSPKYISLLHKENYNKFLNILDEYFNSPKVIDMTSEKIECDILFSLCGVDSHKFIYKKHYAIQHGFDHLVHGKFSDSKTTHICNNKVYGELVKEKFDADFMVAPLPVSFSNQTTQREFAKKFVPHNKKIATIFFPRKGSIRLVSSIIKYLKKKDYFVVVKQRRKNQQVPNKIGSDIIVYDDIWYPSESIFYPAISDMAIGFGSAIFTDLCDAGIPVIDNAIPKYTRKGGLYIRPNYENYWYIDRKFYKNTINAIDEISSFTKINKKIVSEDVMKQFYLDLLDID